MSGQPPFDLSTARSEWSAGTQFLVQVGEHLVGRREIDVILGIGRATPARSGSYGGQQGRQPAREDRSRFVRITAVALAESGDRVLQRVERGQGDGGRSRGIPVDLRTEMVGERGGARVVEDRGRGQRYPGSGAESVAELDRGQRIEAELLKTPLPRFAP